MEQPMDYDGPQLEIILRDSKTENTPQVIEQVLNHANHGRKIGIYLKDKVDGPLTQAVIDALD